MQGEFSSRFSRWNEQVLGHVGNHIQKGQYKLQAENKQAELSAG